MGGLGQLYAGQFGGFGKQGFVPQGVGANPMPAGGVGGDALGMTDATGNPMASMMPSMGAPGGGGEKDFSGMPQRSIAWLGPSLGQAYARYMNPMGGA